MSSQDHQKRKVWRDEMSLQPEATGYRRVFRGSENRLSGGRKVHRFLCEKMNRRSRLLEIEPGSWDMFHEMDRFHS